jgi:hypothetical protein
MHVSHYAIRRGHEKDGCSRSLGRPRPRRLFLVCRIPPHIMQRPRLLVRERCLKIRYFPFLNTTYIIGRFIRRHVTLNVTTYDIFLTMLPIM